MLLQVQDLKPCIHPLAVSEEEEHVKHQHDSHECHHGLVSPDRSLEGLRNIHADHHELEVHQTAEEQGRLSLPFLEVDAFRHRIEMRSPALHRPEEVVDQQSHTCHRNMKVDG